jgi:hypothetical protein
MVSSGTLQRLSCIARIRSGRGIESLEPFEVYRAPAVIGGSRLTSSYGKPG